MQIASKTKRLNFDYNFLIDTSMSTVSQPRTGSNMNAAAATPSSQPAGSLKVYNTLSRNKEQFQTVVPGQVKMYLCGPTVYKPAHIGHMVGPVIFDTVKRYLSYSGYKVTWVV